MSSPTFIFLDQASRKPLPPFVLVMGLHRSGSSCLAGVLHNLGVYMGDQFCGVEKDGGHEARGLARICQKAYRTPSTELKIPLESLRSMLAQYIHQVRNDALKLNWPAAGGKFPQLCAMGELIRDIVGDSLRVIHINRPLEVSIRSLQARYDRKAGREHSKDQELDAVQRWLWARKQEFLKGVKHLTIEYEDLLARPNLQIKRIVDYLRLSPSQQQLQNALSYVQPDKRHFYLSARPVRGIGEASPAQGSKLSQRQSI